MIFGSSELEAKGVMLKDMREGSQELTTVELAIRRIQESLV